MREERHLVTWLRDDHVPNPTTSQIKILRKINDKCASNDESLDTKAVRI